MIIQNNNLIVKIERQKKREGESLSGAAIIQPCKLKLTNLNNFFELRLLLIQGLLFMHISHLIRRCGWHSNRLCPNRQK